MPNDLTLEGLSGRAGGPDRPGGRRKFANISRERGLLHG